MHNIKFDIRDNVSHRLFTLVFSLNFNGEFTIPFYMCERERKVLPFGPYFSIPVLT